VRANRAFLARTVRYLAGTAGIRQFLDIGTGIPTANNTHQVAQSVAPQARVVYADNDPIVLSHGRALLAKDQGTTVITADARDPLAIIDHPQTTSLIDFSRPVAVLFIAVFHFIASPGHPRYRPGDADPAAIMAAFRDRLAPGSCVAVSHLGADDLPSVTGKKVAEEIYDDKATAPIVFRSRGQVEALFEGWELVPPGVVRPWQWHPGADQEPRTRGLWAGVARL
jgi:hypothetical protein